MFARFVPLVLSLVLLPGTLFAKGPDPLETRQENIEFLMWSEDSSLYMVKVTNANNPSAIFQVRDTETGAIVMKGKKAAVELANSREDEPKIFKKMAKAWNMTQEPVYEAVNPRRENIMVMTGQKKDKFVIMGINGDRATRYEALHVMRDSKDNLAKTFQKQLVWDQDGKHLVIIYRTKLDSDPVFEGDLMYVTRFKASRVKAPGSDEESEE